MEKLHMFDYPNKLNIIFDKLELLNIKSIIIGGFVRDFYLKNSSNDIDIEIYGVSSLSELEEILKEFGSVNSVGKSFGVCKLSFEGLNLDFSLPRTDSKFGLKHADFNITTYKNLDFKTAALRRDFRMNAIGYDTQKRKILDPYKGREDLKNRILNAVDDTTFQEDPLRVLRALQFASRFQLQLSKNLSVLCTNMVAKGVLKELSKERIFDELKKLLLKSSSPSVGFKLLKELGMFNYFIELKTYNNQSYIFMLEALDKMATLKIKDKKSKLVLALALVTHGLTKEDSISFITRLSGDKELLKRVLSLTQNSLKINYTNTQLYKLAQDVILRDIIALNSLLCEDSFIELQAKVEGLGILDNKLQSFLQGRDLVKCGIKPSVEFSHILNSAYEAQMREEFTSYKEALIWLDKSLA